MEVCVLSLDQACNSLDNGHALIRGYTLNLNTQRPINGTPIYLLSWELCTLGLML